LQAVDKGSKGGNIERVKGHQGEGKHNHTELNRFQTGMRRSVETPLHTILQSKRGQRRGKAEQDELNSRFHPPRQALAHHATAQSAGDDDSFSPAAHRVVRQIALRERDLEGSKVVMMSDGEEPAATLHGRRESVSFEARGEHPRREFTMKPVR